MENKAVWLWRVWYHCKECRLRMRYQKNKREDAPWSHGNSYTFSLWPHGNTRKDPGNVRHEMEDSWRWKGRGRSVKRNTRLRAQESPGQNGLCADAHLLCRLPEECGVGGALPDSEQKLEIAPAKCMQPSEVQRVTIYDQLKLEK